MLPELPWLIAFAAVFGLLWGSFLNVCIYRVVRDLSVVKPRSFCPECEAPIAWYDNVPLISYVALRGRCRACRGQISLRYPLVELATAVLMGCVVWRFGWTGDALKWAVWETLAIILFWTDLDVQILPDEFTLSGVALGAIFAFFVPVQSVILTVFLSQWSMHARSLLAVAVGLLLPIPLWGFAAVYSRVRRLDVEALGLGDVKLVALIGVFFGVEKAIPVLMIGAILGALAGVILLMVRGRTAWKQHLPFGTFVCAAGAVLPLLAPGTNSPI